MAVATCGHPALRWDGGCLHILDQTLLPRREVWIELTGSADTAAAIRMLQVRGAPLIGIAAAYGLALELAAMPGLGTLERAADELRRIVVQKPEALLTVDPGLATAPPDSLALVDAASVSGESNTPRQGSGGVGEHPPAIPPTADPEHPQPVGKE